MSKSTATPRSGNVTNYRTPWDDLDVTIAPPPIRRNFKLSAAAFYLSTLPVQFNDSYLEDTWNKATNARELRSVLQACLEYEKSIARKIAICNVTVTSTTSTANAPSSTRLRPTEASAGSLPSAVRHNSTPIDLHRKRGREVDKEMEQATARESKRVKSQASEFTFRGRQSGEDVTSETITNTMQASGNAIMQARCGAPRVYTKGQELFGAVPYLHDRLHKALEKLFNLVAQSEGIENNLSYLHHQSDLTISSLNQSLMSRQELEEALSSLQKHGREMVVELETSAVAIHSRIGSGSACLAHFKALDNRKNIIESYDLEIDWQIREMGLVRWWLDGF